MKLSLNQKIANEAARIADNYISILENGKEPATLLSIIEANRNDILEVINDRRVNTDDTIQRVRWQAHFNIKGELQLRPNLGIRLAQFRAERKAKFEQQVLEEQRNWLPLPAIA